MSNQTRGDVLGKSSHTSWHQRKKRTTRKACGRRRPATPILDAWVFAQPRVVFALDNCEVLHSAFSSEITTLDEQEKWRDDDESGQMLLDFRCN